MLNDNDDADFVKLVQRKATCGILCMNFLQRVIPRTSNFEAGKSGK